MSGFPTALLVSAMKAAWAVRAINIIAILGWLVGFLLAGPHAAFAPGLADAAALSQQVTQLYSHARYSEAISLAQCVLALRAERLIFASLSAEASLPWTRSV